MTKKQIEALDWAHDILEKYFHLPKKLSPYEVDLMEIHRLISVRAKLENSKRELE